MVFRFDVGLDLMVKKIHLWIGPKELLSSYLHKLFQLLFYIIIIDPTQISSLVARQTSFNTF